ncbi:MAG: glycosyltransferase [Lachnospiraceae bacterium]|nr:glycosyltransferase [Lachnospiraceae bacterium]MCM1230377.1 glycosyltransferase [Ruminococcus flavefaciens]
MKKYSVLMSLYKKEHPEYLRLALDSMINQTVKPDEIVLVEDGPLTSDLYEVVKEYTEKYPELLHIVVNKKNLGLGLALNIGLKACRNELIARMDTDDISKPDRCEKQLRFFSTHPTVTILGGQIEEFINSPNEIVGKRIVPQTDRELKEFMKKRCPFNHMTVMFKKSDVMKAGSYKDWFWNEDYYLWIRLALRNYKFANLGDTLVNARVGIDMYQRRGGDKYFKSEIGIQKLMLEKNMIGIPTFIMNCAKRLIVEKLMPNRIRGWVFQTFARE